MKTVNNFPEEVELYKFTFKNSEEEGEYRISGTSLQEAINTANKMLTHENLEGFYIQSIIKDGTVYLKEY
jgi:hypothetical protein